MVKQLAVGSFDHVVYQAEKKLTVTKAKLSLNLLRFDNSHSFQLKINQVIQELTANYLNRCRPPRSILRVHKSALPQNRAEG